VTIELLDSNGVTIDLGRTVRLATTHQRRALLAMYDTCAIPGCTISSRHCQPHHIHWWTNLGPTNLGNLTSSQYDPTSALRRLTGRSISGILGG
jgi:hypothetical protein